MKPSIRTRRDRWADWAVIGVVVVALLLGWAVMTAAESACDTITDKASELTACIPQNWLVKDSDVDLLSIVDPSAAEFKTTYQVRSWPVQPTESVTSTLALALNSASLTRAQSGVTAYRLLGLNPGPIDDEQVTMESTYVYVADGGDLFAQNLPVTVMGLDVAVVHGEQAYVFSLAAARDAFADAEREFRRFLRSAEFE